MAGMVSREFSRNILEPSAGKGDLAEADKIDGCLTGQKIESEYFYIRAYKKGTLHLIFKSKVLLDRFNLIVGRQRQWLDNADKKVPKAFWLMNK